ncbi:MAG: MurR/RpiR family transcriptional regulator [Chloroflexi bacterium]|nr:MurR/RpiR family transcriptional regulator [Chloroflexota bacterium]
MPFEKSLENRITQALPHLSRSHKKLARFVLDNSLFVAFASIIELSEKTGVSAATVVRFCQAIDYAGYPNLQATVRAGLPTYIQKTQQLEQQNGVANRDETISRVFDLDRQNLTRTLQSLNVEHFDAAMREIAKASDILVVAGGLSAGPALYLAHSLQVMGFNARVVLNGGTQLALELTRLRPTSILIGISVWRYITDTVQAIDYAQRIGAKRIAITDSLVSPLAQRVDYAFQAVTEGVSHSLSLTAIITLVNAFVAALSFMCPKETTRALRKIDKAYRQAKLVMTE